MAIIGIDISKHKFDCLWLRDVRSLKVKTKVFANRSTGFAELIDWCCAQTGETVEQLQVFLEATGVYHEPLALYLHDRGVQVFVLNPARVREYARSLGIQGKTDKQDSLVLARYGATQPVRPWTPERREVRELKALIARHEALQDDLQRELNRREKKRRSAGVRASWPPSTTWYRLCDRRQSGFARISTTTSIGTTISNAIVPYRKASMESARCYHAIYWPCCTVATLATLDNALPLSAWCPALGNRARRWRDARY